MAHLAALLNVEIFSAVGIMEMLWHFTAKFAPQGDIGKHSDAAIAKAVGWQRPTGERGVTPQCKLSDALVEAKWLEKCPCHRLIVHDWPDHADQAVTKYMARNSLSFVHPRSGQNLSTDSLPVSSLALPLPFLDCQSENTVLETSVEPLAETLRLDRPRPPKKHPDPNSEDVGLQAIIRHLSGVPSQEPLDKVALKLAACGAEMGLNPFQVGAKIERARRKASKRPEWKPETAGWFFGVLRTVEPPVH